MKLTKASLKQLDGFIAAYDASANELQAALDKYESARDDLHRELESIRDEFRGEYDDKSERWQESERGQACEAFIESWTTLVELVEDELTIDDLPTAEDIQGQMLTEPE